VRLRGRLRISHEVSFFVARGNRGTLLETNSDASAVHIVPIAGDLRANSLEKMHGGDRRDKIFQHHAEQSEQQETTVQ